MMVFLTTFKCSISCGDCCFKCSPQSEGEFPLPKLLRIIERVPESFPTIKLVVFTGGECFLRGKDLLTVIRAATEKGLLTRCVTNGYWATDDNTASEWARELKAAGLGDINFSTGNEHQKYIPFERVAIGARHCAEEGINTLLVIEGHPGPVEFTEKQARAHPLLTEFLRTEKGKNLDLLTAPWISTRDGRSAARKEPKCHGCEHVMETLVFTPDEHLLSCCGLTVSHIPEFDMGRIEDASDVVEKYREQCSDFLRLWLRVEGPMAILEYAVQKGADFAKAAPLVHPCEACRAIFNEKSLRTVLEETYREKIPEVLFRLQLMERMRSGEAQRRRN
ncbi:MAG: hypothetical protein WC969_11150 [Elusimicrobiota bacterium]